MPREGAASRVRVALRLFILAALLAAGALASTAYNAGSVAGRAITLTPKSDAAAYLTIAGNGVNGCFVTTTNGKIALDLSGGSCTGVGTGLAAGDGATAGRYAQIDLNDAVALTNAGDRTVGVWVNATTSSGSSSSIKVQVATATGSMTDGSYATTTSRTALAIGATMYVGVQVNTGTLGSGSSVTGSISIDARGTT